MSVEQTKNIGEKYALLDLIGTGGMAEVYRAQLLGNEGFEKRIVIKKLLHEHTLNKELVQVFIGEARLAALLQHENITAIYDFGQIDGDYFLAMEYLFGKDLYSIIQRAKEHSGLFEVSHALKVVSKVCEGMDYAHNLTDFQDNPLKLVHRDLTPHNIFITYDGKVKILDFGIAKAEILDNRTKAGVVKGKLSYMSPEQLTDGTVDLRSDIFSIGILLYEMISKKRMYQGDTAELIRKCISVDYAHLEGVVPGLQPELYAILHKALAQDVSLRYQNCAEMQADIEDLLFSMSERQDSRILKESIQRLFAEEYELDKIIKTAPSLIGDESLFTADSRAGSNQKLPEHQQTAIHDSFETAMRSKTGHSTFLFTFVCLIALVLYVPPTVVMKDGESAVVMKDEESAVVMKDEESAVVMKDEELAVVMKDEELAVVMKDEELAVVMKDEELAVVMKDEELAVVMKDEESAVVMRDEESAVVVKDEESAVVMKDDGSAVVVKDSESAVVVNDGGSTVVAPLLSTTDHTSQVIPSQPPHAESTLSAAELSIQHLHQEAQKAFLENRLLEPEQDSAAKYYRDILHINPEDRIAIDGLRAIGDRYAVLADKALAEQKFLKAEHLVDVGLLVAPEYQRLNSLKGHVRRNKHSLIQELSEKAKQRLFVDRLTTPKNDSAFLYYSKILAIDPKNVLAKDGIKKIGARYAFLANRSYREFDYEMTADLVKRGLEVVPDNTRLLELKNDLERSKPEVFFKSLEKNILFYL